MKHRIPTPLALAGALAALVAGAPPAQAGTYTITASTTQDISGWSFAHDAGFVGCSRSSYPGVCADGDIARPTPLRLIGFGDAPAGGDAMWTWTAPPTTSIVSGSLSLYRSISADNTSVYMKARLRSGSFSNSPQLHTVQGTGNLLWAIPADNEVVAVGMRTAIRHAYLDKWNNHLKITSLTATLRDDAPPTATLSGPLADGAWHNQAQPVAVTVNAADAGAGVKSMQLLDAGGGSLDIASATATSASQPGSTSVSRALSVAPAGLGDGTHSLSVLVSDAAGEQIRLPLTVRVDAHAPFAAAMTPAQGTTERRPLVAFQVDGGPSGLAEFDAWLDGQPMAVSGSGASLDPTADLAFGTHVVTWHAADGAGNIRDGEWSFQVVDQAPPVISDQAPADGWSGELRQPPIGFTLTDAGSGVDPASLRVALDGLDMTAAGDFSGGRFTLTPPAPLGFAAHTLRVLASDRSGNVMPPVVWRFTVADSTPPVLSDPRPDPNSAGSDRTPAISFAAEDGDGSGVDAGSLVVTIDGLDISAAGSLAGGRFTYTPSSPLGFGVHTVSAQVSDRAGNTSAPRSWSFTVRDETPPVVAGRQPAPGITVAGAATIAFDASDAGTGVDASTLHVLVDGSDVVGWGAFSGGHFSYSPGNLGAGVHTISVSVADAAGNQAGPVMWQFAVADPATLGVAFRGGPASIVAGAHATLVFAATASGAPLAFAHVLVSTQPAGQAGFGPARTLIASASGLISWPVAPARTTVYRVALADDPGTVATRTLTVRQRVLLAASAHTLRRGSALRLSGRVQPLRPGVRVALELLTRHGWAVVARPRLGANSSFSTVVIPPVSGRYLFRAVVAASPANAAGTSPTVAVFVR